MNDQPFFERVVLVGCGLIGGSLALAFKENGLAGRIVGVDRSPEVLQLALDLGVIDTASELEEAVTDADLIVLATPVLETVRQLELLSSLPLKEGCVITDAASTKRKICHTAETLLPTHVHFVGGHPMAGSEKSGVQAAHSRLFENAVYVLAVTEQTDPVALQKMTDLLLGIRSQVLPLAPDEHDQVVAAISHIPHVVAAQLVDLVADLGQRNPLYSKLAAGGFRDVTRIASGSPVMWTDIVATNQDVIRRLLQRWIDETEELIRFIDDQRTQEIQQFFTRTRDWRDALPARAKGAARNYYECTVYVEDRPGIIAEIATILGNHRVNLRNIGILENREESNGQLLLSFATQKDWEDGIRLLLEHTYRVQPQE